ncbi:hypothetical protein RN001_010634 [Aquatica leii]|uniref:C2H2-type domain-containing protein n=1 Tax=Aquatica leii TaxID=1421715 RepID=A0AAN7SND7_9COLE|nr:hypothetical protein RN001_010634 [Aquatica leii]
MDFKIKEEFNENDNSESCKEACAIKDELSVFEPNNEIEEVMNNSSSGEDKSSNYISSYEEFLSNFERTPLHDVPTESTNLPVKLPLVTVTPSVLFKCEHCDYNTRHQDSYLQHLPLHMYPYKCIECHFGSKHRFVVMNHYQMNHVGDSTEKPYTVIDIPSLVDSKIEEYVPEDYMPDNDVLTADLSSMDDKKVQIRGLFECASCDYSTTTPTSLDSHMQMHLRNFPYKCNKCEFTAEKSFTVLNHYQLNHVSDENNPIATLAPFECHVCNFITPDVEAYNEHTSNCYNRKHSYLTNNVVSDANHYRCHMCDFEASHSFVLKNHMWMAHEFKTVNDLDGCIPVSYLNAIVVKDGFTIAN